MAKDTMMHAPPTDDTRIRTAADARDEARRDAVEALQDKLGDIAVLATLAVWATLFLARF
ncbi:MAG: hypothetical protein ACE37K_01905 [Planctomycetota bacterium]